MNEDPTNADEQYILGCYYKKKGDLILNSLDGRTIEPTKQCEKKAFYLFTKAAEQGHADAQYEVGHFYIYGGFACNASKRKAKYWYTKAAEQGNQSAKDALADLDRYWANTPHPFCYVATCIYGSYDCPEVWTLRRYRDSKLSSSWFGRRFIRIYYAVSPRVVKLFGNRKWFHRIWKPVLNKIVRTLQNNGIESDPYLDMRH